MLTLLASALGFLTSAFPDVLKMIRDAADRKHELAVMDRQFEISKANAANQLAEINANADISESKAIYTTYNTGVKWVDALNGTVRPILIYAFFLLYATAKLAQISTNGFVNIHDTPWLYWSDEDNYLFAGMISFYFGNRSMQKFRQGK